MDLVIVGNGFDLAHDMPTAYKDFEFYLKSSDEEVHDYLVNLFPRVESNVPLLWSDFEAALIYPDKNEVEQWQTYMNDVDEEEPYVNWLVDMLQEPFSKWVEDFCFIGVNQLPTNHPYREYLKQDNKFLSFNYTETLEHFYCIYDVLHIHGRAVQNGKETGETIFFGHEKIKNCDIYVSQTEKPVEHLISKYKEWFNGLAKCIDGNIVVIGFSCSEVDMPYLLLIRSLLPTNRWIFFYHTQNDFTKINKCISSLNLKEDQYLLKNG